MWSGHRLGQLTTISEKNIIFVLLSFINTFIHIDLISVHKDELGNRYRGHRLGHQLAAFCLFA